MLELQISIQTMKCDYSDIRAMKARLRRAFNEGAGSIMSLQGNYFSMPHYPQKSDADCIREDWENVGKDLRYAMRKVSK